MVFRAPILALVLLASRSDPAPDQREILMNYIERHVVLPKGALPLSKYARYYSDYEGRVVAVYTTETEYRPADYGCSEMVEDFQSRDIECPAIADAKPGERRWVAFADYPGAVARDSHAVHLLFNKERNSFESVMFTPDPHGG